MAETKVTTTTTASDKTKSEPAEVKMDPIPKPSPHIYSREVTEEELVKLLDETDEKFKDIGGDNRSYIINALYPVLGKHKIHFVIKS